MQFSLPFPWEVSSPGINDPEDVISDKIPLKFLGMSLMSPCPPVSMGPNRGHWVHS